MTRFAVAALAAVALATALGHADPASAGLRCGPGRHWVPGHYVVGPMGHRHWIAPHCA